MGMVGLEGDHSERWEKGPFLWACLQLMVYPSENFISTLLDVDEKTLRKWSWSFLLALSDLERDVVSNFGIFLNVLYFITYYFSFCFFAIAKIIWTDRFEEDDGNDCLTSVDCTDYRVEIQGGPAWFSYKFRKPGLRYEICLCIKTEYIVWINGPFPCGDYNDITIFSVRSNARA